MKNKESKVPKVEKLLKTARKYSEELFVFLYEENLEGTNNIAERAIRPAVIQRKVNGGHRSWLGAHTYATLMTLIQTCRIQGKDFLQTSLQILRNFYQQREPGLLI